MIIIDSVSYDIPVLSITRRADFLDKFAERTADGKLHRELIGVYFNYQLKFGFTTNMTEYQLLWNKLTQKKEFHTVVVPNFGGTSYTFTAYFSNVGDEILRTSDTIDYWKNLTVNFIARDPAL